MRSLSYLLTLCFCISGCGSADNYSYDEPEDNTVSDIDGSDEADNSDEDDSSDQSDDGPSDPDPDDSTEDSGEPVITPDPAESGDWAVSVVSSTEIDAELYLPDGDGPFPVVLFSPGFQLNPSDYQSYAEHFASWGYITALVNFEGGLIDSPTHYEMQQTLGDMIDWFETDPAVLNGTADTDAIALMGHSMGGKLSLLRASYDSRVDAVVGIDPVDAAPPFGGSASDYPSVAPERMGNISAPLLLIGEVNNATRDGFLPACAPADENFQAYFDSATGPALEVDFTAASHMSFVDNPSCLVCLACPAGTDDPVVTKKNVRAIATAFLESEIHDRDWAGTWLSSGGITEIENTGLISTRSKNGF